MYPTLFTFTLGGTTFTAYAYGTLLFVGIVIGVLALYWQLRFRSIAHKRTLDNVLWIILGGIAGARIGYILLHIRFYLASPKEMYAFWHGGIVFYGAFVGGLTVALIWLMLKKKSDMLAWMDSTIVAVNIGHAVGMMGSFLVGSHFGKPTSLPWGVVFPLLGDGVRRHPTQIYEALGYLFVGIVTILLSMRLKRSRDGAVFFAGLGLMALVRFVIEFVRVPERFATFGSFTISPAHVVSLVLICVALFGILKIRTVHTQKNVR